MGKSIALISAALLLAGCAMGPNYKRPTVAVPTAYRGALPDSTPQTEAASLGDQKWWDIFQDEQLRTLSHFAFGYES
jgi:multidrug efflux system outer membrane protein